MINLRRSAERHCVGNQSLNMWKTFEPANLADPFRRGFRALKSLEEVILPPGTTFNLPVDEHHEIVTYVREGALLIQNGTTELLRSGYVHRASSHPQVSARVPMESQSPGTHLFLSSLKAHPNELSASCDHKHFPFADRHGHLRLVACPNGGADSIPLQQDVRLYSALLEKGHHVIHELSVGRGAWLHVVAGKIQLIDLSLESGDGASVENQAAVSFTAQEPSEILLFDLP